MLYSKRIFSTVCKYSVSSNSEALVGSLWFLPCLMICVVLYAILTYTLSFIGNNKCNVGVSFVLVLGASLCGYYLELPRNIDLAFILMFWFWIGEKTKCLGGIRKLENTLLKQSKRTRSILFVGAILICAALNCWIMTLRASWREKVNYVVLAYFGILAGIFIIMLVSICVNAYSKKRVAGALEVIGKHTIVILAFHQTCFRMVDAIQALLTGKPIENIGMGDMYHNGVWIILYPVIGILLPLTIVFVIQKAKQVIHLRSH